ncbi:Retrovirus-related Pol polyprotein from transposon TNT 1-94 [Glycine soja]
MAESTQRFEILLFYEKINFMIWQSTIQDLLVQQGLDQALEDERPTSINETEWTKIQRKVVSTIRLALAPEIKHNVLKETTSKTLALLLLVSLPRSFKALVQMLLVGRPTLNLDEVITALRENERMMRTENVDDEHNAIVVVESE